MENWKIFNSKMSSTSNS